MQNAAQRILNEEALTETLTNGAFAIFFLEGHSRVGVKMTGLNNVSIMEYDGSFTGANGEKLVGWYEVDSMRTWAVYNAEFQGFDAKITY